MPETRADTWLAEKPWLYHYELNSESRTVPFDFVYIEDYYCDGDYTLGHLQEDGTYMMGDGDCWKPEEMEWLGSRFHFFFGGVVSELLRKYLKRNKRLSHGTTYPKEPTDA